MLKKFIIAFLLIPAAALGQQWKLIAPMNKQRVTNIITFLNDGRLFAAGGGSTSNIEEPTSETYDPNTNSWSFAGSLNTPRGHCPFVKLLDGRIFIAGGWIDNSGTTLASSEIFDPSTNKWSYSASLLQNTENDAAVLLPNGKVLVGIGGIGGTTTYFPSCELFDPATNTFQFTGSVNQAQVAMFFLDTTSGNALLFGGHEYGAGGIWYNEVEEYTTATGTWNVVAHSVSSHDPPLRLPNGEFISPSGSSGPVVSPLIGVQCTPLIEIYNPRTKQWRTVGNLPIPRYGQGVAYIGGDSVLVGGGLDPITGRAINDCRIINLKTGVVSPGPPLVVNRATMFVTQEFRDPKDQCTTITRVYAIGGVGTLNGSVDLYDATLSSCEMIEFRHQAPSTLSIPQALSFNGSVCTGIDTSISVSALTCSTDLRIDSVVLEGLSNSSLATKLPDTLKNGAQKNLQLSLHSSAPGIIQGSVRFFFNTGGTERDTLIPITMNLKASTRGTIRSIIHDISDGGDTISIPIYLASNSGDRAQSIQLSAHYNTDLLSPIDPEFKGTLTENALVWDQNKISGGINFFVQQPFLISTSKPLVILKFKTAVTLSECTSFVIDNLQILFDSTGGKSDPCPLAVIGDSATICRGNACGDNSLRGFMRTGLPPQLKAHYDSRTDRILIEDPIKTSHQIEVLNMLGVVVQNINSSGGEVTVNASDLSPGIYFVRSFNFGLNSQKISIVR